MCSAKLFLNNNKNRFFLKLKFKQQQKSIFFLNYIFFEALEVVD